MELLYLGRGLLVWRVKHTGHVRGMSMSRCGESFGYHNMLSKSWIQWRCTAVLMFYLLAVSALTLCFVLWCFSTLTRSLLSVFGVCSSLYGTRTAEFDDAYRAAQRHTNRELATGWDQWYTIMSVMMHRICLISKMMGRIANLSQAYAFDKWHEFSLTLSTRKVHLGHASTRRRFRAKMCGFNSFFNNQLDVSLASKGRDRAIAKFENTELSLAWNSWHYDARSVASITAHYSLWPMFVRRSVCDNTCVLATELDPNITTKLARFSRGCDACAHTEVGTNGKK